MEPMSQAFYLRAVMYRSWNRQVMTIQAADDSEVLTAAQVNATHDCGFWDSIAPKF
jgi:hypothetical protein